MPLSSVCARRFDETLHISNIGYIVSFFKTFLARGLPRDFFPNKIRYIGSKKDGKTLVEGLALVDLRMRKTERSAPLVVGRKYNKTHLLLHRLKTFASETFCKL